MTFVTTWLAVAGAAAMAIPIIIHLIFRQRKRPIEWAAMRFLIEAFRRQKRRLQLEQILLLAVRCMIVLVLGLALARPLLQGAGLLEDDSLRTIILVIDDGLASQVVEDVSSQSTAFDRHVEQAISIVNSLGESDAVGIVTASRPASGPILPPSIDHAAVIEVLEGMTPALTPTDLDGGLRLARSAAADAVENGGSVAVYLFSDFREGSVALETNLPNFAEFEQRGGGLSLLASPAASTAAPNVQVTAVAPMRRVVVADAADASQQVTVHLARHGGDLGRTSTKLRLSGAGAGLARAKTVEWSAGQTTATETFSISFEAVEIGQTGLSAVVDDVDAMGPDNRRFITLEVREKLRVALVSPPTFERISSLSALTPGQWIRRALHASDASPIEVTDVAPASLDDIDLRAMDAAIVTRPDRLNDTGWLALREFVDRGGLLMFVPPSDVNVHQWTDRLRSDLSLPWRIALEAVASEEGLVMADTQPSSELLRMLQGELGEITRSLIVYRYVPVEMDETQAESILLLEDGAPLMIMGAPEDSEDAASGATSAEAASTAMEIDRSRGLVVYLATAPLFPEWTTLPVQMFMVPLFQETIRQGISIIRAQERAVVGDRPLLTGLPAAATGLRAPSGADISFDAYRRPVQPLGEQGLYGAIDAAREARDALAVNIETGAARTEVVSAAAVQEWLNASGRWRVFRPEAPAAALASTEGASSIAGILLASLLILVLLETILARWFSHAFRLAAAAGLAGGLRSTVAERRGPVAAR